jgi:UDP-N-acetylmuramoyl-tripeptide--D-alanyl-D-alanine ligase
VSGVMLTLEQALPFMQQAQLLGKAETAFSRVHTDTRTLQTGDLFVALRGDRFDAHSFLPQLKALGCAGVVAEHGVAASGVPGIEVPDSKSALGELALGWRKRFSLPLVAVTGSNGKTTVTQLIASIFAAWHGESHRLATQGNFNNDIGLPLTLLRLRDTDKAAVVEIGMNHVGEVAQLARMAMPTVAVVNNAQREHQEFMGSVAATALENGAVFEALADNGTAVIPVGGDQADYEALWRKQIGDKRCLTFGSSANAQGSSTAVQVQWKFDAQLLTLHTPWGVAKAHLSLLGLHNAHNAAAAASAALVAGAPIEAVVAGLEAFQAVKGRLVRNDYTIAGSHLTLIDDTYNANPDSVIAAINVLAQLPKPQWLVLGDMGEVGDKGEQFHREVGLYARQQGVDWCFALGDLCKATAQAFDETPHADARPHAAWFSKRTEVSKALNASLKLQLPGSVLIKGSRFMKMEEFVAHTKENIKQLGGVAC